MAGIENTEWLNQNLLRAYPLREDADMTPRLPDGTVAAGLKVPTCLVADFSFTLPFDAVDGTVPSLTGISHAGDGFSLEISLGDAVLATVTARLSEHAINTAYPLEGRGDNADCGGWIVLGDLRRAAEELPEGVYRLPAGQVPFEVSTLRMAPRGVRSVTAVGRYGLQTYAPLYGNVRIVAGADMTVRTSAPENAIWLQAESQTGYERTTPCECGAAASGRVVRRINGISAENVEIVGDDGKCVTVSKLDDSTIQISDACATPCCGCAELNFVESALATINKSLSVLQEYANALSERVTELTANEAATSAALAAYPTPQTPQTPQTP